MSFEKYLKYKNKYLDIKNVIQNGGAIKIGEEQFLSYDGKISETRLPNGKIIKDENNLKYNFRGYFIYENGKAMKATISHIIYNNKKMYHLRIDECKNTIVCSIFGRFGIIQISEEEFSNFASIVVNRGINWEIKIKNDDTLQYKKDDIVKLPGIFIYNNDIQIQN
jgi:hypothetical protein